LYEQGRGVALDKTRAAMLYRRACEAGLQSACDARERVKGQ
jgi:TPR repeat protein